MAYGQTSYADFLRDNEGDLIAAAAPAVPRQPAPVASPYDQLEQLTQQRPAPQPPPTAPTTLAPVAAPKTRSPKAALDQLRAQDLAGVNETTASIEREGAAKVDASKKAAGVKGEASAKSRRYVDAAEREVDDNRILKNEAQQWLAEDMRKLREPPLEQDGWQKATTALTNVLGGVLTGWLGPVGGGLAAGLQAIDDHVNRNVRQQLEEQARAEEGAERTTKYMDALGKDSANELDIGSKLVANNYLATSHELEKLAEQAKVPELQEGYRRLALESQAKGRAILERNYEQQLAEQRAAAAARAKAAAAEPQWQNMPPAVLEQMEAQGTLPLAGLNVLNEARKKALDAKGKPADAGNVAPVGREVADPEVFASIKPEAIQKFREYEDNGRALLSDIAELDKLLQTWGTETNMTSGWLSTDESEKAAVRMNALNKSIQLKLKQRDALGTLDNGSVAFLEGMTGDPNSLFTSGESVRQQLDVVRQGTLGTTEEKAKSLGLGSRKAKVTPTPDGPMSTPEDAAPAPTPSPATQTAPPSAQRVTMYGPGGMVREVKPDLIEAYRNQGFTTEAPRAQAAPEPLPPVVDLAGLTPEEYETLARMGGNY